MKFIPTGITRNFGRQLLRVQKNSPRTLFIAGIAGSVISTVLACRATLKLEATLTSFNEDIADAKPGKDMVYTYIKGSTEIAKLYAPAALVGSLSIGALTGSHVTLSRRNAGLTTAYVALQRAYDEYREKIVQELGPDKEREVALGLDRQEIKIDGKVEAALTGDPNIYSPYARIFDESNRLYEKYPEMNKIFIQCQQNHANDILQARGHIFLNEVYDMLGFEHSSAGSVVGWVISKDNGDNFVDFGLYEDSSVRFINGSERSVILDFNVDGVIYHLIDEER